MGGAQVRAGGRPRPWVKVLGWGMVAACWLLAAWSGGVGAQEDELVPLGIIVQPEPRDLQVRIETDQSRYDLGDKVEIRYWVNRDAYIYIYNLDATGRVSLIFPNRFDPNNRVRAGSHRLPGRGYAFEVRGPAGVEYLQIIASSTPIHFYGDRALEREAFPDLGAAGLLEERVRAELRTVPGNQWAVDWTSFRVGRQSPPPPPPPARRGWLRVLSTPSGAEVRVDGDYEGRTPLRLSLQPGWYRVELRREGYQAETDRVRVRAGDETTLQVVLEPLWEPAPLPPLPPPSKPEPPPSSASEPSLNFGLDVGWGPDPEEPSELVFSFGGEIGGPNFGFGFSLRATGDEPSTEVYDRGPETELYARLTLVRAGDLSVRAGFGLAWQEKARDGGLYATAVVPTQPWVDVYPTFLLGAGVERGPGYVWAGYHVRRGMVLGAGVRF